jgi:hypothetical protein
MSEPILMPFQSLPFNGDTFICEEFLNLKEKFNITTAIETGSCVYSTTQWLGNNFGSVLTAEVNDEFAKWGKYKIEEMPNVCAFISDSVEFIKSISNADENYLGLKDFSLNNAIFFLDAHWGDFCPLLNELKEIANKVFVFVNPIIAIHDFKVPNEPTLGYDSINGQAFDYEWIKKSLEAIYGVDGYDYYYNSHEKSTQIKRGIIYITPKI